MEYRSRIQKVLQKEGNEQKIGLKTLISGLILEEKAIKIALFSVNRTGPVGAVSRVAPPRAGQQANGSPALTEDTPPLPALLLLRSKSYLYQLYANRKLSARQIASLTGVSHSVVLAALDRHGIPRNGNGGHGPKRKGRLPYGFEVRDGRLVKHRPEQAVIRLIRQYHASGLSLRAIAGALNRRLVPTKHYRLWQANTVRKILARA